jgi:hypothetical protein
LFRSELKQVSFTGNDLKGEFSPEARSLVVVLKAVLAAFFLRWFLYAKPFIGVEANSIW